MKKNIKYFVYVKFFSYICMFTLYNSVVRKYGIKTQSNRTCKKRNRIFF